LTMAAHRPRHPHQHADARVAVHHEESDVHVRAIFAYGVGLLAVLVLVAGLVWLLFASLRERAERRDVAASPFAEEKEALLPPEPRLQVNPKEDLRQLRAAEDAVLNGYRWVDRNAGIVRIPIDEAIRLTLERGLPSRDESRDAK
jgi:hypothetical protein